MKPPNKIIAMAGLTTVGLFIHYGGYARLPLSTGEAMASSVDGPSRSMPLSDTPSVDPPLTEISQLVRHSMEPFSEFMENRDEYA